MGLKTGRLDIAERVPSARRPALAALMEKNSFTNGTLTPYESWAAALLLSSGLQKDLKLKTGGGVESQLEPRFLKKGKPIIGLETVEGQLGIRSEEHTSELQSLMRISYAVLCFKNKTII